MSRGSIHVWTVFLLLAVALSLLVVLERPAHDPGRPPDSRLARLRVPPPPVISMELEAGANLKIPLTFIANGGQLPAAVGFSLLGQRREAYFTPGGVAFRFVEDASDGGVAWVLHLEFVGADPSVRPVGDDPADGIVSYFVGPPSEWHAGLPTFRRIVYRGLWPGIDLVFRAEGDRLEYEFEIDAGADPGRIRLAYRGASGVFSYPSGWIVAATPAGALVDAPPRALQRRDDGGDDEIPVAFTLDGVTVGFEIESYDRDRPLVIDPAMVLSCGFLGGAGEDDAFGIDVGNDGAIYVVGTTNSTGASFPVAVGPDPTYNGGTSDAFIAKVAPSGETLLYCGFLGGNDEDFGEGVAVDSAGCAYVTGHTASTQSTFPVSCGPDLTYNGGPTDGYVAKVHATGAWLCWCGYLGGSDFDYGTDIAVDALGEAYVVGMTSSLDFPVAGTLGPSYRGGGSDVFVTKVSSSGLLLRYSGFLGGAGVDYACGVDVDTQTCPYVTGATSSLDFPTAGSLGPVYRGGAADAFVVKIDPTGSWLVWGGFLGGEGLEQASGIAVDDATECAFVAGYTGSKPNQGFPVTVGPDLTYNGGELDAFVAKVSTGGDQFLYCGYIGGAATDLGMDVAVDAFGRAWVAGGTESTEDTFPVALGPDRSHNGEEDGFIARVAADGSTTELCGYLGGGTFDRIFRLAVDAGGNVDIAGSTNSTAATFPVAVGPDPTYNGGSKDAFVARVPETFPPSLACREGTVDLGVSPAPAYVLTLNGSSGDGHSRVVVARGASIAVAMDAPPSGPNPAPFAMYAWVGVPVDVSVTPLPKGIGDFCFPTPITGGAPQPKRIWNNLGREEIVGAPHYPSEPAPSTPLGLPGGIDFGVTVTFQGLIRDDGSAAQKPGSVTNAVILVVP